MVPAFLAHPAHLEPLVHLVPLVPLVHLVHLALLPNHVDRADHMVLAIHLPPKARVVLAVLSNPQVLEFPGVHVVQVVLDIPELLAGRVLRGSHLLLAAPPVLQVLLVPLAQLLLLALAVHNYHLLLAPPQVQPVQDNLGLPAVLVVPGYLVPLVPLEPLVVRAALPIPDASAPLSAVFGCSSK